MSTMSSMIIAIKFGHILSSEDVVDVGEVDVDVVEAPTLRHPLPLRLQSFLPASCRPLEVSTTFIEMFDMFALGQNQTKQIEAAFCKHVLKIQSFTTLAC